MSDIADEEELQEILLQSAIFHETIDALIEYLRSQMRVLSTNVFVDEIGGVDGAMVWFELFFKERKIGLLCTKSYVYFPGDYVSEILGGTYNRKEEIKEVIDICYTISEDGCSTRIADIKNETTINKALMIFAEYVYKIYPIAEIEKVLNV